MGMRLYIIRLSSLAFRITATQKLHVRPFRLGALVLFYTYRVIRDFLLTTLGFKLVRYLFALSVKGLSGVGDRIWRNLQVRTTGFEAYGLFCFRVWGSRFTV